MEAEKVAQQSRRPKNNRNVCTYVQYTHNGDINSNMTARYALEKRTGGGGEVDSSRPLNKYMDQAAHIGVYKCLLLLQGEKMEITG